MDNEIKELLESVIDDPKLREARQRLYNDRLKEAKTNKDAMELKLRELKYLKVQVLKKKEIGELEKAQLKQIDDQIKSTEQLIKASEVLANGFKKTGDAVFGLAKAAFKGEGSISALSDNFKGLGRTGDLLGFLGNRLDVSIETFRGLAQSGASFGQSIIDLRIAANQAGLPLDDFANLVKQKSEQLAAMFGTTSEGARQFGRLANDFRKFGIQTLAPLGFTVDEINETMLTNLEGARRAGTLENMTAQQRIQSSMNFAKALDGLAKVTGLQRDQVMDGIEMARSNERFQAFLTMQTDETRQRLEGFAGTITKLSPQLATGFQDLIANGGRAITPEAQKLAINIRGIQPVIQALINGSITQEQALEQSIALAQKSGERFSAITSKGVVDLLNVQGAVIDLGNRQIDLDKAREEKASKDASGLTQTLTLFEDAFKRLSGQFQLIETGLLQAFGPKLGGLVTFVETLTPKILSIADFAINNPQIMAAALTTALAGTLLLDFAKQVTIVSLGTAAGIRAAGGMGGGGGFFGGGGSKKGKVSKLGKVANFGKNALRRLPLLGALLGGADVATDLASDDPDKKRQGKFGLGGGILGALLGFAVGGPVGAAVGFGLGTQAGGALGAKQFGGNMAANTPYLVGERGPELVMPGKSSAITANTDLQSIFNTDRMENSLISMVNQSEATNKNIKELLASVNMLVGINDRTRRATENTAKFTRASTGGALMA